MTVDKISTIKSAGAYMFFDSVVNVVEVTSSGRYRGTCILPSGKEFSFSNSASGLQARIANDGINPSGKKVVIPCGHADHSTCHGEHVTKVVSSNKLAKQYRKLMLALSDIKDILPNTSDDIVNLVHTRWFEYSSSERRKQAEVEARKAEIAAKKAAEEEAKKQAELIQTIKSEQQVLLSFGMSAAQVHTMLEQKYGAEILATVF